MINFFAFTYPKSKRVCKVLLKIDIFHGICKKTKIVISNALFLAPNFDFFTRHVTRRFVAAKRLCGHVTREDLCANFWFQSF
jgi:hypothetical protein